MSTTVPTTPGRGITGVRTVVPAFGARVEPFGGPISRPEVCVAAISLAAPGSGPPARPAERDLPSAHPLIDTSPRSPLFFAGSMVTVAASRAAREGFCSQYPA